MGIALTLLVVGGLALLPAGVLLAWAFRLEASQRRLGARLNIAQEADALIKRDGDMAYNTAREFSMILRETGKRDLARYWGNIALNIADKQGKVVGETAADDTSRMHGDEGRP